METKKVRIKADRTAAVADLGSAFLVEGNTDYEIEFIFDDASWDEYPAKTAYFSWGRDRYAEVVFTGSVVQMPAITGSIIVYVGVYAGDLRTSADAIFGVLKTRVARKDTSRRIWTYIIKSCSLSPRAP